MSPSSPGGRSSEHDISLASARSVLEALDPARYEVVTVEIGRDGRWELAATSRAEPEQLGTASAETLPVPAASDGVPGRRSARWTSCFPSCTGRSARTGPCRACSSSPGVPYVGAGVARLGAGDGQGPAARRSCATRGIPVTRNITFRAAASPLENPFGYPVFVKPARLGSSVGITKVRAAEELAPAVELALRHDEKVLVEEFVRGIEVECGVLGNDAPPIASLPGEIVAHGFSGTDWYDFSAKYDEGGMELVDPAADPRGDDRAVQERRRRAPSSRPSARAWPASTSSSATTARCS